MKILDEIYEYWFTQTGNKNDGNLMRHWIPISKEVKMMQYKTRLRSYMSTTIALAYSTVRTGTMIVHHLSRQQSVALVVALDQFTRTYDSLVNLSGFRFTNATKKLVTCLSANLSLEILDRWYDELNCNELIFILMPFKHLFTTDRGGSEQERNWRRRGYMDIIYVHCHHRLGPSEPNLQKFYADTVTKYYATMVTPVLVPQRYICKFYNLVNVCDRYYLGASCIDHSSGEIDVVIHDFIRKYDCKNICVSLSGGVDSMVIATSLARLAMQKKVNVSAFHLIYKNRAESLAELEVVKEYCSSLNLPLYTFTIDYVQRRTVHRVLYEKLTRDIRFSCYRKLVTMNHGNYGTHFMLGHIKDDVIENIVMNISRGLNHGNLYGMDEINTCDGVLICRPLLTVMKKAVLSYAHKNCVPYLKNTTPTWSVRHKLRSKLVPLLEDVFTSTVYQNLYSIAEKTKRMQNYIDKHLIDRKADELLKGDLVMFTPEEMEYITEIMARCFHRSSMCQPSRKSMRSLIDAYDRVTRYTQVEEGSFQKVKVILSSHVPVIVYQTGHMRLIIDE